MLPFFRKIRYRLAKDNHFFKYSRYAIGEIVLVVLGILIALYINNWNEERKERIEEKALLEDLKQDNKKGALIWLEEGIKLLAERGIENLNIDELSSRTGKAKTSFYHFFSSKSNFLERLALYWEYYYSLEYFEELSLVIDPTERFEKIIEKAHSRMKDEIVWIYFKERGKKDEKIGKIVHRVEQGRLRFLTQIFTDMNYPILVAKEKASLFMYLFFGWSMLNTSNDSLEVFKKIVIQNLLIDK